MNLVNPIRKKPVEKADLKAYACVCSIGSTTAPYDEVWGYGHLGCVLAEMEQMIIPQTVVKH